MGSNMAQNATSLQFARRMRSEPTPFEVILWRHLSGSKLGGFKFRRQHVIERQIVDFFCPVKNLIVEVDGDTHDPERDAVRDEGLRAEGYRTLRFTNTEVANELEAVLQTILDVCMNAADRWPHPNPSPEGEGLSQDPHAHRPLRHQSHRRPRPRRGLVPRSRGPGHGAVFRRRQRLFQGPPRERPKIPEIIDFYRERQNRLLPVHRRLRERGRGKARLQLRDCRACRRPFGHRHPLRLHRPAQGQARRPRGARSRRELRGQGLQVSPPDPGHPPGRPHRLSDLRGDRRI